jgi:hypothetical protein
MLFHLFLSLPQPLTMRETQRFVHSRMFLTNCEKFIPWNRSSAMIAQWQANSLITGFKTLCQNTIRKGEKLL